jgi:Rps23 Pro-64 3,4-dihydroxylase Tpa1-like proline 4-hydroxylase
MYNIVINSPEVLVVDDFLNDQDWDRLLNQVQLDAWSQTQPDDKYWHWTDGVNYKNTKRFLRDAPFDDNFDIWFNAIKKFADTCEPAQQFVKGYTDIAMRCHAYPVGSKNPWHTDMGGVTYSYYLHKHWQINWDATLLILPKGSVEYKQVMPKLPGTKQYDSYKGTGSLELFEQANKVKNLIEYGVGTFVSPKPNRLILINKNVVHGITRVDPDAGENLRISLTGFFNFFKHQVVSNANK